MCSHQTLYQFIDVCIGDEVSKQAPQDHDNNNSIRGQQQCDAIGQQLVC